MKAMNECSSFTSRGQAPKDKLEIMPECECFEVQLK